MYEQYWGLDRSPFRPAGDSDYYFAGEVQNEALARLDFITSGPQRLALLLGESGTGKTTLLHHAARQYRRGHGHIVEMSLLGLDDEEFVLQLADSLGVDHRERRTYATIWRGLMDQLLVNRYQNLNTVLLFDDVDNAEDEVLRNVVRLTNWRPGEETEMTIILAAHTDRVTLLGSRLIELADLRVDLFPWEQQDVAGYLQHAITQAGRDEAIFAESAIDVLFQLTDGNPRRVRQLAELALIAAAGAELTEVDSGTILAVQDELSAQSAAA